MFNLKPLSLLQPLNNITRLCTSQTQGFFYFFLGFFLNFFFLSGVLNMTYKYIIRIDMGIIFTLILVSGY